ncbi:uncharacterized protein LOC143189960 isoform X2 [Rhynchophorus ferrugineus]|uniref:uncharacterized protein LOC143189960 isoform X2 n=1 Tax=Rhynchophorus ferrugineus TaxID=354439 RepID=UPI003FCEB4C2
MEALGQLDSNHYHGDLLTSGEKDAQQKALRSRQLNPCDPLYWKSRGYPDRPINWKELLEENRNKEECYDQDENCYDEDYDEYEADSCDEFFEKYADFLDEYEDCLGGGAFYDYYGDEDCDEDLPEVILNDCRRSFPQNTLFWTSRGYLKKPSNWKEIYEKMNHYSSDDQDENFDYEIKDYDKDCADKSNYNNRNNSLYWRLKGYKSKPGDWKELLRLTSFKYSSK